MIKLIIQCLICWSHGFKTKTGNEHFIKRQSIKENRKYYLGSQRNPRND